MSHILLKKIQNSLISTPAANYVKFFSSDNDGGLLYYMNSSGIPTPVGGSGVAANTVIYTTYSSLYSLYQNSSFATGSFYYITDFESIYDQPDFYFDGTLKTSLESKGKPTAPYQPIIVVATSENTLDSYAYQPSYPNDRIKYDISWTQSELNSVSVKGRITERIDSNDNRTDYDHRTIRFKRYQAYERIGLLTGNINDWDCITGVCTGSGTSFSTELSVGDVILLNSDVAYGGLENYTIGLKIKTINSDNNFISVTSSLYASGVPSPVTLNNMVSQITPINYSFASKNYTYFSTSAWAGPSSYGSYKEVYFGQGSTSSQFIIPDYNDEAFTFETYPYSGTGLPITQDSIKNNYIGNYSQKYLSGLNNTLILSNNCFLLGTDIYNNKIGDNSYNNTFIGILTNNQVHDNIIYGNFYNNMIWGSARHNIIGGLFYNNYISDIEYNSIFAEFGRNVMYHPSNFRSNSIDINLDVPILNINFITAYHVIQQYNCNIFLNSNNNIKLSYYNGFNQLVIDDIDD